MCMWESCHHHIWVGAIEICLRKRTGVGLWFVTLHPPSDRQCYNGGLSRTFCWGGMGWGGRICIWSGAQSLVISPVYISAPIYITISPSSSASAALFKFISADVLHKWSYISSSNSKYQEVQKIDKSAVIIENRIIIIISIIIIIGHWWSLVRSQSIDGVNLDQQKSCNLHISLRPGQLSAPGLA